MYIGGLAGLELLRKENPAAAETPRAVAGLSLGEYTALTVAGVFDLETGLFTSKRTQTLKAIARKWTINSSPNPKP